MRKLSIMEKDFLKELTNIGIGHAATSLGKMVNSRVKITIPEMKIIPYDEIIKKEKEHFSAVTTLVSSQLEGYLVILFTDDSCFWIIDKMYGNEPGTTQVYTEEGRSAIKEFYNIIGGSFISGLSDFLDLRMLPSIPELITGQGKGIKESIKQKFEREVDKVLSVRTQLSINEALIEGKIYFVLYKDSFETIYNRFMDILMEQTE